MMAGLNMHNEDFTRSCFLDKSLDIQTPPEYLDPQNIPL